VSQRLYESGNVLLEDKNEDSIKNVVSMREKFECLTSQSRLAAQGLEISPRVKILPLVNNNQNQNKFISKAKDFFKSNNELIVSTSSLVSSSNSSLSPIVMISKNTVFNSPNPSLEISSPSPLSYSSSFDLPETTNIITPEEEITAPSMSQVDFDFYNEFYARGNSIENEQFLIYHETTNTLIRHYFSDNLCLNFLLSPPTSYSNIQENLNEQQSTCFKFTIDNFKSIIESFSLTDTKLNLNPRVLLNDKLIENLNKINLLSESFNNLNLKQINVQNLDIIQDNSQNENFSSLDSTLMFLLKNSEFILIRMSLESIKNTHACNFSSSSTSSLSSMMYDKDSGVSSLLNCNTECNTECNLNLTQFYSDFECVKRKLDFLLVKKLEFLNETVEMNAKNIESNNKLGNKVDKHLV
jgi:hypothetical protein